MAFTGPSGGGKSTIVKLLEGFYPLTQGRILVNGVSLSDMDQAELLRWRRAVGTVEQEPVLVMGKTPYIMTYSSSSQ